MYPYEETSYYSSSREHQPGPLHLIIAVVLSICFILGVPGNIAVIFFSPNWQHLSSLSKSLMLNLAVSDLICLSTLPAWIYELLNGWKFSPDFLKILAFIVLFSIHGSLLTVTGLSVQRYLMVVHQKSFNQVQIRLLLVLLWLVAFILSIPVLVDFQVDCRSMYCFVALRIAVFMTEILIGLVSLSVIVFSYICLRRKIGQAAFFNNPKTSRLIISIIVNVFALWFPFVITHILGVAAVGLSDYTLFMIHGDAWNIVLAITFVNRCLNPLLYALTSCKFCIKRKTEQPNQRTAETAETIEM